MDDIEREEAEARVLGDRIAYSRYNPAQRRAIAALDDPDMAVLVVDMGNGSGKTFVVSGAMLGAIMFGSNNPLFKNSPFVQNWTYPKELRIVSTTEAVKDRGPIQMAMRYQWPEGRWTQKRGTGKGYYSEGRTDTGWNWDVMTYNQHPSEFSAHTKGLNVYVEPPPYGIYSENQTRLRAGGLTIFDVTPLNYAAWIKEELIDPGHLILDGRKVGKVILVTGTIWDNCKELHDGGQLSKLGIERTIASWPQEEREARETGAFMHLAGRVYKKWGDDNEIVSLAEYHQECWDKGLVNLVQVVDPHDRKPWAMSWEAIFPNDDNITVAEWPDFSFARCQNSPISDIEDYRDLILAAEQEIGRVAGARLIDPNFGNAPKAGRGMTVKQMLAGACRRCKAPSNYPNEAETKKEANCPHKLFYRDPPDDIPQGHTIVRGAIGNVAENVRPKTYALKSCENMCYGMRHYGFKENKDPGKGPSETPELIHKDFADLKRYLHLSGLARYQAPIKRQELWTPKLHGKRISAT